MTLLPSCRSYIFIGLTFCDTIYLSTEHEASFLFFLSCCDYIRFTTDRNVAEVLRMCQTAERLSFPQVCHTISLKIIQRGNIFPSEQHTSRNSKTHHTASFLLLSMANLAVGYERRCELLHLILCTRGLIPRTKQMLTQRKPSGSTCVVAPPKRWPGSMVLPKVAQIPVTLVLH